MDRQLTNLKKRLSKKSKRGFRGYPVGTLSCYGPDDRRASKLPETPESAQLEFDLLMTLSPAVIMTKGMASDELGTLHERAFELASATGNQDQSFRALFGSWMYNIQRPPVASAKQVAEQLDEIAQATSESSHQLQAHHALCARNGRFLPLVKKTSEFQLRCESSR